MHSTPAAKQWGYALLLTCAWLLVGPAVLRAQTCRLPDAIRAAAPAASPRPLVYQTLSTGPAPFGSVPLGIGFIRPAEDRGDSPPGTMDWLRRIELPLSREPDAPPTMGIVSGWIVGSGATAEALAPAGMIETTYEGPSLVVLEGHPGGWLRVRYAAGEGGVGTAWLPECALERGPFRLEFVAWSEWLLSDHISPLYVRSPGAAELRSSPASDAPIVTMIAGDHALEPIEIRGEWMRVTLKQPSDYCAPDVVSVRTEGWIRWSTPELGPLVWYYSRGC